MKKFYAALLCLVLLVSGTALASGVTLLTPVPAASPDLVLRPSADEVKAYESPSLNAKIAGYIIPGSRTQKVNVLYGQGSWYYVSFTSIYGVSYGWIPASCFMSAATSTPVPTPTPSPTPALSGSWYVTTNVSGNRLNLRTQPSQTASSLGKYYAGTPVQPTGRTSNGYYQVRVGTLTGWMDARYLTSNPYALTSELPQVTVNNPGSGLNLRLGPSTGYQKVAWLPHGTAVTVLGIRQDGWYHVMALHYQGFVSSEYLSRTFSWQYGDSDAASGNVIATLVVANGGSDNQSCLHLRKEPSTYAESLGLFYGGTVVEVLSYTRTGWAQVRIGQVSGYMDMRYLGQLGTATLYGDERVISNPYGTGLNLRTLPSTQGEVLLLCPNGATVTVLGELKSGWSYVQVGNAFGYMTTERLVKRTW